MSFRKLYRRAPALSFADGLAYLLVKNAELYRRLAQGPRA